MDRKEYVKKYRESHKEYAKRYEQENKERIVKYQKEYRNTHKDHIKETSAEWRKNNPGHGAQWHKDNPEYKRQWNKTEKGRANLQRCTFKRRALRKLAANTLTAEEWQDILKQHEFRCIYCGKQFSMFKMTKDHIIPISKGGDNSKENIVPACKSCNSRMSDNFELKLRTLESRIKKKKDPSNE